MAISNSVIAGLVIIIVILVGALGTLTGYFVLPAQKTTTTQQTTTATTIQPTTTKPTTIETTVETTIQKVIIGEVTSSPCSPCFNYFEYVNHNTAQIELRNGARTVIISGYNIEWGPGEDITLPIDCSQSSCDVEIKYKIKDTGVTHTDSATLHNFAKLIALIDANCDASTNIVKVLLKNDGIKTITTDDDMRFYIDEKHVDAITPIKPPLDPGVSKTFELQSVVSKGTHELRIVGPNNVVGGTVNC